MSHFSINRIRIKNPNIDLLRSTISQLAKEMNGELVSEIEDFYGRKRTGFIVAVKTPSIPWGVGVRVADDGSVEVVADRFRYGAAIKTFEQRLVQLYTAKALGIALANLGYQVETQEQKDVIMLRAVSYA